MTDEKSEHTTQESEHSPTSWNVALRVFWIAVKIVIVFLTGATGARFLYQNF